jgi:hypothetical protein
MKKFLSFLLVLGTVFTLSGCDDGEGSISGSPIDLSWICPAPQKEIVYVEKECPECNVSEEQLFDGIIKDITDKIDVNSIKMNHYVDEVLYEENYAEPFDYNGHIATKNMITLPAMTNGVHRKHVLVIEFEQIQ